MNPPIDDIFNLFPAWFYLSPTSLDYCAALERGDQCHTDSLPESMLEGYTSNSDIPFFGHPSLSTSFIPPSFNELLQYDQEQESLFSPSSSLSTSSSFSAYQKPSSVKRSTRIGFCEHPKHVLYRQSHSQSHSTIVPNGKFIHSQPYPKHHHQHYHYENHCQKHICKKLCRHHHFLHHLSQEKEAAPNDSTPTATTPRRGRPPKGTKPSERLFSDTSTDLTLSMDHHHHISSLGSQAVEHDNSSSHINYHIAMTTRPLPKRLESVVGKSNIYVCLTCLKRSDMDVDYLMDPSYVGPQSSKKRKKSLPPNLA